MRPPIDGITRTKPLRIMLTSEIFDALQKLAGLDNVPTSVKAYQVLKQYVAENQSILTEYEAFRKNLHQYISQQSIGANVLRQSITVNKE